MFQSSFTIILNFKQIKEEYSYVGCVGYVGSNCQKFWRGKTVIETAYIKCPSIVRGISIS